MQDAECKREENLYKPNKGNWDLYKLNKDNWDLYKPR